ncbi:hypothetical protein Taro_051624 [Colocasia esculenta]|uniref:Uncharacterized protein n=1 Tax=Colocasia esculenta TaxID=4460 RepID=A0A843XGK4_COLES|nr:hypothetical protein [Colocasia esculenta]
MTEDTIKSLESQFHCTDYGSYAVGTKNEQLVSYNSLKSGPIHKASARKWATTVRRMLTEYEAFPGADKWKLHFDNQCAQQASVVGGRVESKIWIVFQEFSYSRMTRIASGEQSSGKMASSNQSPISPPPMRCVRGHSYCIVRTSKTERNPKRKFYTCKISLLLQKVLQESVVLLHFVREVLLGSDALLSYHRYLHVADHMPSRM